MQPKTLALHKALNDPSVQTLGLDPDGCRFSASTGVYTPRQRVNLLVPETLDKFRKDGGWIVVVMGGCDYVQRSVKNNPAPVAVHTPDEWKEIHENCERVIFAAIPHRSTPFFAEEAVIAHLDDSRPDVNFGEAFKAEWVANLKDGKFVAMKKKKDYSKDLDIDQFDATVAYYVGARLVGDNRKDGMPVAQPFTIHNPDEALPAHVESYNKNCSDSNYDYNGLRNTNGVVDRMRPLELFNESFRSWLSPILFKALRDPSDPLHKTAKQLASIGADKTKPFSYNANAAKGKKGTKKEAPVPPTAVLNGDHLDHNLTKAALAINFTVVDGRVQHRGFIYHSKKTGVTEPKSKMTNDEGWTMAGGNGYRIRAKAPAAAIQHDSLPTYKGALKVGHKEAMKILRNQFQALSTLMRKYLDESTSRA